MTLPPLRPDRPVGATSRGDAVFMADEFRRWLAGLTSTVEIVNVSTTSAAAAFAYYPSNGRAVGFAGYPTAPAPVSLAAYPSRQSGAQRASYSASRGATAFARY